MTRTGTLRALAVASVLGGALASPLVAQGDPLPAGCSKEGSTITCTQSEPVGNSGNTKTTTTTVKASFESSHPEQSTFTNPGGNQPAGQQP